MFRILLGAAFGYAVAKLTTDTDGYTKLKNVAKKCSDAVKNEFAPHKDKEADDIPNK